MMIEIVGEYYLSHKKYKNFAHSQTESELKDGRSTQHRHEHLAIDKIEYIIRDIATRSKHRSHRHSVIKTLLTTGNVITHSR